MHIFLARLDGDFEQVQGEILHKNPILDLEECYALARQEAMCHGTMKGESDNHDPSAMVDRQRSNQSWSNQSKTNHSKAASNIYRSTLKCTHCNKIGHIQSRCFELV